MKVSAMNTKPNMDDNGDDDDDGGEDHNIVR